MCQRHGYPPRDLEQNELVNRQGMSGMMVLYILHKSDLARVPFPGRGV